MNNGTWQPPLVATKAGHRVLTGSCSVGSCMPHWLPFKHELARFPKLELQVKCHCCSGSIMDMCHKSALTLSQHAGTTCCRQCTSLLQLYASLQISLPVACVLIGKRSSYNRTPTVVPGYRNRRPTQQPTHVCQVSTCKVSLTTLISFQSQRYRWTLHDQRHSAGDTFPLS